MHTILGAGGSIGNALQQELEQNNQTIRLVSRRKIATTGATSWKQADLCNFQQTLEAAKGSQVLYLCAGLRYDVGIWKEQWPLIMENAINVAKETGARLIFFDNVYMYGLVRGQMLETTSYNPCSKKGEIRAKIADQLMSETSRGNLRASIARSPDFYGGSTSNSFFDMMVLSRYAKKQRAQWLGNPDALHSFILVRDAAKAVALLGESPQCDNQVWHLPTAPPMTGKEFLHLASQTFGTQPSYSRINKFMLQMIGMFNPPIKNSIEMYYQNEFDYQFNSDKFENMLQLKPTSYEQGFSDFQNSTSKIRLR
jgi:nucleoside-diphosphate-sugar epimerase